MADLNPALAWPLVRLLSVRRARQHRTATAVVTIAVGITVALSFAVTALIGTMVRGLTERVVAVDLPFDAVVLFTRQEDVAAFLQDRAKWDDSASLSIFPWAHVDAPEGGLTLLGMGDGTAGGSLRPVSDSLPGWRYASLSAVNSVSGSRQAIVFKLSETSDRRSLLERVRYLGALYPCTVVTELSGRDLADAASRRAFTPWQTVSFGVVLMSAAAISCVLAVTFLGRKRSLGILKVLGSTTRGLMRLFFFEAALMGGIGIPVGFLLGLGVAVWALGQSAVTVWCFAVSAAFGLAALAFGVFLPILLVRNGSCDQLLNNRPVYAISNPSCAKCGLCGGF